MRFLGFGKEEDLGNPAVRKRKGKVPFLRWMVGTDAPLNFGKAADSTVPLVLYESSIGNVTSLNQASDRMEVIWNAGETNIKIKKREESFDVNEYELCFDNEGVLSSYRKCEIREKSRLTSHFSREEKDPKKMLTEAEASEAIKVLEAAFKRHKVKTPIKWQGPAAAAGARADGSCNER